MKLLQSSHKVLRQAGISADQYEFASHDLLESNALIYIANLTTKVKEQHEKLCNPGTILINGQESTDKICVTLKLAKQYLMATANFERYTRKNLKRIAARYLQKPCMKFFLGETDMNIYSSHTMIAQTNHEKAAVFEQIGCMLNEVQHSLVCLQEWLKNPENYQKHTRFGILFESQHIAREWNSLQLTFLHFCHEMQALLPHY